MAHEVRQTSVWCKIGSNVEQRTRTNFYKNGARKIPAILKSIRVIFDIRKRQKRNQQLQKKCSVENDALVQAAHDKLDEEVKRWKDGKSKEEMVLLKSLVIKAHLELNEEVEKFKKELTHFHNKEENPFAALKESLSFSNDEFEEVTKDEDDVEYIDPKMLLGSPIKSLYTMVDDVVKKYLK